MRILLIGDVIGKPGRKAVTALVPKLRKKHAIDIAVVNGENAAGGIGLTPETSKELFEAGIDVITSGNHIWHHKNIMPYLDEEPRVLRPLNMPPGLPGKGYLITHNVMIVNLLGRVFIGNYDCPFRSIDHLLEEMTDRPPIIIVDFHAEATAEKMALGWYLDGRVSAVVGTHTHVGTIDTRILPKSTAYITDIGMVGPSDSIIGDDTDSVLERFLTMLPHRLSVGKGKVIFNSVLVHVDDTSGQALTIERIDMECNPCEG